MTCRERRGRKSCTPDQWCRLGSAPLLPQPLQTGPRGWEVSSETVALRPLSSRPGGSPALARTEFSGSFPPTFPSTFLSPFASSGPSLSSLPANLTDLSCSAVSALSSEIMNVGLHTDTTRGFGPSLALTRCAPAQSPFER